MCGRGGSRQQCVCVTVLRLVESYVLPLPSDLLSVGVGRGGRGGHSSYIRIRIQILFIVIEIENRNVEL